MLVLYLEYCAWCVFAAVVGCCYVVLVWYAEYFVPGVLKLYLRGAVFLACFCTYMVR